MLVLVMSPATVFVRVCAYRRGFVGKGQRGRLPSETGPAVDRATREVLCDLWSTRKEVDAPLRVSFLIFPLKVTPAPQKPNFPSP